VSLTFISFTEALSFWVALAVFTIYLALCVVGWTQTSPVGQWWPVRKFVISNNAERFLGTGVVLAGFLAWSSSRDYKNTLAVFGAMLILEMIRFNIGIHWHRRNEKNRQRIFDPKRINFTNVDEHAVHPGIGADNASYGQWPVVTDIYTGARLSQRRGTGRRMHYVRGGGVITVVPGDFQKGDEIFLTAVDAQALLVAADGLVFQISALQEPIIEVGGTIAIVFDGKGAAHLMGNFKSIMRE